ncbi:MAG TPA: prepilin-type N-terminal cleavage/methylation domain-containing protein [Mollicutes bacterium]|nr:prepilin-type N-terminal cleavage/methylation domain-containing protein [Mollicutes bacterium]
MLIHSNRTVIMKKGFTLIELLTVIVVLAVILAITVSSISNIKMLTTKNHSKVMLKWF